MEAARLAGLKVMRVISEPVAAAMAAGYHKSYGDRKVLVFDFGGSTFNATVLEVSNGTITEKASTVNMNLGGRDLDQALVDYCLSEFKRTSGIDKLEDKPAIARLKLACERAKISLS